MAKEKISETAVGAPAPIVVYAGSAEEALIAPHKRITIASNIVGAKYFPSTSLYTDDVDPEDSFIVDSKDLNNDDDDNENDGDGDGDSVVLPVFKKAPTLMDIELVSNTVVYDPSGNPSAKIVFKVRNSSGEEVKSVNARVKVL
jgi:hypothetical protein